MHGLARRRKRLFLSCFVFSFFSLFFFYFPFRSPIFTSLPAFVYSLLGSLVLRSLCLFLCCPALSLSLCYLYPDMTRSAAALVCAWLLTGLHIFGLQFPWPSRSIASKLCNIYIVVVVANIIASFLVHRTRGKIFFLSLPLSILLSSSTPLLAR